MTANRVFLRRYAVACVVVPLLLLLPGFRSLEFLLCCAVSLVVGLVASGNPARGHLMGFLAIFATVAGVGLVLGGEPSLLMPQRLSERHFMTLLLAMKAVLLACFGKVAYNRLVHGRFLLGGQLSGLFAGGLTFLFLSVIWQLLFLSSAGSLHYRFSATPVPLPAIFAALLLLCTMLTWRGKVMPRFLRAPKPLPMLPSRRGMTLIELLIVVAMLAILTASVANLVRVSSQQNRRAHEASLAVRLARERLEVLRGNPGAIREGTAPESAGPLPVKVVVAPLRPSGLWPVSVEVEIGAPLQTQTLRFEALIPAVREAGS